MTYLVISFVNRYNSKVLCMAVHSCYTYDCCFWNMKMEAVCSTETVAPLLKLHGAILWKTAVWRLSDFPLCYDGEGLV
jgi:hypothetical protein